MKIRILLLLFLSISISAVAQDYRVGTTTALWLNPTAADYVKAEQCGIEYVEVAFNQCYRGVPPEEVASRLREMKAQIEQGGMKVWSVHLPFSRTLDISVADDSLREVNVRFMAEAIQLSAIFKPMCLVLHSSSEPIADIDREQRLANASRSIALLKPYADAIDAELCVENLPRTCLGNTPEELLQLVETVPGVKVCFDTNHYQRGSIAYFMEVVGHKIGTIHASDFDFVHECHWLPTQGKIDWGELMYSLEQAGYKGVFMYEATKDHANKDTRATLEGVADTFEKIKVAYNNATK